MALRTHKIENGLGYEINAKRAKRQSHKIWKREMNRKQRKMINSNIDYVPSYNKNVGYEF